MIALRTAALGILVACTHQDELPIRYEICDTEGRCVLGARFSDSGSCERFLAEEYPQGGSALLAPRCVR